MSVIPLQYVEAHYNWLVDGDPDLHWTSCAWGLPAVGFAQSDADVMIDSFINNFKDALSSLSSFRGGYVLVGTGGEPLRFDVTRAVLGLGANTRVPTNCCVMLDKKTGVTGRHNRGRMFLWAPGEGDVDNNGFLSGSALTLFDTDVTDWITATLAGAADRWVILHDVVGLTPTNGPATGIKTSPQIATQRRRMRP